jgi:hypothetical protein
MKVLRTKSKLRIVAESATILGIGVLFQQIFSLCLSWHCKILGDLCLYVALATATVLSLRVLFKKEP